MSVRAIRGVVTLIMATLLLWFSAPPTWAELAPPGPFEQVVNTTIPSTYSELLNFYERSLGSGAPEALGEISTKLSFYTQTIGRVCGALDIGGKLYLGQDKEAAVSAGLVILGELAGSEAGKAYLGAMGLTTLPVTALITAYQIYQISASELQKSTVGVKLESLYLMIENDPKLKDRNRDIGMGDPIPVSAQALEYLWRKVLLENQWRDLFKTYVEEELSKEWPDPGLWNRWTLPGNVLEEAEMFARRDEFKSYMAGLLGFLNRAAKVREQQYLMRKYADELNQKATGLSANALLSKYLEAVTLLPEVREFVTKCPTQIQQGLNGDDLSPLIQVINNSKRYAVDVVAWLPVTGKLGTERSALLDSLRAFYDQAWSARAFLQQRREQEALRVAQTAPVSVWRATSYGFPLEFAELLGAIEQEFSETGTIDKIQKRIAIQVHAMNKHYENQRLAAVNDYTEAQQMDPIPPERNKDALETFSLQLGAYRSIDQQRVADLNETVAAYVDTLTRQMQLDDERLQTLATEIDQLCLPFQSTGFSARGRIGGVGELEDVLSHYCGSFSSSGYLGIGRLQFPSYTPSSGDDVWTFASRHYYYLQSIGFKVAEAKTIPFCGGDAPLLSLINGIDHMVDLVERFALQEDAIAAVEEKVAELELLLQGLPWDSSPRFITTCSQRLTDVQKPFVKRLREALKQGVALKDPARAAQQLYRTDLENIENDEAYLAQLGTILGQLSPLLKEFAAHYPRMMVPGSNDSFVLRQEVQEAYLTSGGSALLGRAVFMTEAEKKQAVQQLNSTLAASRLLWLDQNYTLGIGEFVPMYIANRTGLMTPPAPEHYTFIEWQGECRLFPQAFFDDLKTRINGVEGDGVYFLRNLQLAVSGMAREMLGIPPLSPAVDLVEIDLDSYPENGLDFLRTVAKACWEEQTRASVLAVVSAFETQLAHYRRWRDGEAYYAQMLERFSTVVGNLSTLEYDAEAAYNQDMYDPVVGQLYRQAAAKEAAVMGFLAGAVGDSHLSPSRQAFFVRQQADYERRFFFIKQWANYNPTRPAPTFDDQPVRVFYSQFKQAYERKNDAQLISFLDDDWSAGDGTTLYDVEDYFHNMFTVFDEIRLEVNDLQVEPLANGRLRASYTLLIIGKIYSVSITREEKSSVVEDLDVDSAGRMKIVNTPQGRFWYVQ